MSAWRPETRSVKAGRPPAEPDAPFNAPLTMASTYVAGGPVEYGRYGNPTWRAFEEAVEALEGGRALAFASGMAAVSTVLGLVAPGERVVAARHCYQGTLAQLARLEQRGIVTVTLVDIDDTQAVIDALDDDVALLWAESPTNPALEVADIPALTLAARTAGVTVVVDNTFATPLAQRPLELGADVVVHSGTKYLAGHSDALIGVLVTADPAIHRAFDDSRRELGAIPGTLEAWLALRGMRTLPLRVERATANARELARRLAAHRAVTAVRYPGFGAIIAIEVEGGGDAAERATTRTRLWARATSLGGVESLVEHRASVEGPHTVTPESLLRLSIGLEHSDDLIADLAQALAG